MDNLPRPPRDPAARPPARRPGSVRRTSTLLMTWPGGWGTQLRLQGRARDLLTPATGPPVVLAEDEVHAGIAPDRSVEEVAANPHRPALGALVGARAGAGFRGRLADVLPEERAAGTPLYLLLDDVAGSSLIAGFAWSRWSPDWPSGQGERPEAARRRMLGICAGFRPGSSVLDEDGTIVADRRHNVVPVPPLADPDDPAGWHRLDDHPPVAMRRARRIDVWGDGTVLTVDAMFRDSCWDPDGTEVGVHEYSIAATLDASSGLLTSLTATPRVLPFAECPAAAPNAAWLVGVPARALRAEVLERLRGVDCCTHLNDALRSLAEVPVLASALVA